MTKVPRMVLGGCGFDHNPHFWYQSGTVLLREADSHSLFMAHKGHEQEVEEEALRRFRGLPEESLRRVKPASDLFFCLPPEGVESLRRALYGGEKCLKEAFFAGRSASEAAEHRGESIERQRELWQSVQEAYPGYADACESIRQAWEAYFAFHPSSPTPAET